MRRFVATSFLACLLFFAVGCAGVANNQADFTQQETASGGYCHKKLQPVGPSDIARINQPSSGDVIDYYGPCDGPSVSEQIEQQKRYEAFRFGREYMDEG